MDTMRERFVRVTTELLDEHSNLALVLADIGVSQFQGTIGFTETGAMKRFDGRVVNVGIREQLLVSFAAGMALEGFRPIVHTYAPFLVERPFEQFKLDFGHQGLGGIFVSVGASLDTAGLGRTHQAPEDIALIGTLPGWEAHVPGHPDEVEVLLRHAAAGSGPVYIRLTTESNAQAVDVDPGRMTRLRPGSPDAATVIAVGPMLDRVIAATRDMDVNLLYAATVRPFDRESLTETLAAPEVVIVEPYLEGTSAAEESAALMDRPHRLLSLGLPRVEHRHYGSASEHYAAHRLDESGIRERIGEFLRQSAAA